MNATAANLIERVLPPQSGLRQWVLTFPFSWRLRLAQDGALLGRLTRLAVDTVLTFYAARAGEEGGLGAKSGAVTALQRTSSDLRLNPHLHMVVLDGTWCEKAGEFAWEGLGHLGTSEVGEVLERLVRRMERHLRRCGLKKAYTDGTIAVDMDPLSLLCRLATSVPPPRLHTLRYTGVLAPAATGEPAILATNSSGVRFFKALCGRTVLTSTRERVFNQKWLEMRPPQVADLAQQEHAPADAAV